MELKKFDNGKYSEFVSYILEDLTMLREIYNNIIVAVFYNMDSDSINDYLIKLDDVRDRELEILRKYKDDNYDLSSLYQRFMNDFDVFPTTVFDFDDVINIYDPQETNFLRRRHANILINNFEYVKYRYSLLSDIEKSCLPYTVADTLNYCGRYLCEDIYKVFIKLAKEEFDRDPKSNRHLLLYIADLIIANPNLEKYYMDNGFDLNDEILLSSKLFFEYGITSGSIRPADYTKMSNEIAKGLIDTVFKYENDSYKEQVLSLMIGATYIVTGNENLKKLVPENKKFDTSKVKVLSFFNK